VRITGGTLAGRTVAVPPGEIRPAMDRMRESLFSILEPLAGCSFLDLFCGSGIMSLEALSRGASSATLVEKDRGKRRVLERNLALAPVTPRIVFAPAERFVQRERTSYRIIYIDPPFAYGYKMDLLSRICGSALLEEQSLVLMHLPAPEPVENRFTHLTLRDERRYGGSKVVIYQAIALS